MSEAIGFGEGLPRDVCRGDTAFRSAATIMAVAIDAREDGCGHGNACWLEHSVHLVASRTTAASVDVLATLCLWRQGDGRHMRYATHVNKKYEDQSKRDSG
jgi:hypothetical protein